MYTRFAREWLANQPGLKPVQREFLIEALRFYQEFTREDPRDEASLRLLGEAFLRVAQIQAGLGDLSAAGEAGRSARGIFSNLSRGASSHVVDRRLLAEAEVSGGRLAHLTGDLEGERQSYLRAIEIRRGLVRQRPDDREDRLALATALYQLEDVPPTEEAVAILRDLLGLDPRRSDYRFELSNALAYLGSRAYDRGDFIVSERHHREALRLRQELTEEFPTDYLYRRRLLNSLGDLGRDIDHSGRFQQAESIFQQALAVSKTLAKEYPSFPINHFNVASTLCSLGCATRNLAKFDESEGHFLEAIAIAGAIIAQHPDVPGYQTLLAEIRSEYGELLERTGRHSDAIRAYREALDVLERLAPRTTNVLQNRTERAAASASIARLLASSPDMGVRDRAAAVVLARKAAALDPDDAKVWSKIGLAFYRAGEWSDGVEALNKSMEPTSGGDASNWLLMAMACWQKGDKEQARRWYRKAADGMGKSLRENDEFARMRAEAAALLGVSDQPGPPIRKEETQSHPSKP